MNVRRNSSPSPSTLSCPTTAIAKKPWEEQSQVLDVIISSKEKWVAQVIKVCATLHLILWFYLELVILNIYLTAHSPRKFGSDCYVSSVGKLSSLIPSNANLSSGGVVRGRRSRRMNDSALTPLSSWLAGCSGKRGTVERLIAECAW